MKRRQFIKGIGVSSAAVTVPGGLAAAGESDNYRLGPFKYGEIDSLEDVNSREGLIMVRLELSGVQAYAMADLKNQIKIKRGKLVRMGSYFYNRVLVLWLGQTTERTQVSVGRKAPLNFTLGEVVSSGEFKGEIDGVEVKVNFLLDREIGEITLDNMGRKDPGSSFSFVALADPQGGLPDDREKLQTRMKIHNAFVQESVDLVNKLDFDPLFAMVIGDVCDEWGYEKDLAQMNAFLSKLKCPVLYEIGNHETLLRSKFGPGYNMEAFNHFLAAQKEMNGLDKLLYSFNAGNWHFIAWPDPLRNNFWETHPHYFDWLERDLEKHKNKPTMVFQHVPVHPIGITPHISYAESVFVKRTFLDILVRHGNVKYILSGHVHIPLKASFKTAVTYRGIKMITLPAAGYRPRAFGEEDFYGGPSQGVALIHIEGDQARVQFKTVTEELFDYPTEFPEFDESAYGLWLKEAWELPAAESFVNPDFSQGLEGWTRRFVYTEDKDPSNLCEVRRAPGEATGKALYLYCRRRGYQAPGQDRLPQDVNRICQAISLKKGTMPTLRFRYRVDGQVSDLNGFSGAYCWIEGFSGRLKVFNMMYSAGKIWVNIGGMYSQTRDLQYVQMALPGDPDIWIDARLNLARDYNRGGKGHSFTSLEADRLVVHFGVWNINDGGEQPFGISLTGLALEESSGESSQAGGIEISPKPEKDLWWRNKLWPNVNIAGEHRYIISTLPSQ